MKLNLSINRRFDDFFRCAALAIIGFLSVSCNTQQQGQGFGRPDFMGRSQTAPLGITLARLLPPHPTRDAPAYVQLINTGDVAIDTALTRLWLQSTAGSISLPATLWQPGATLTVQGPALQPLDLHGTAGELIVLGADLTLEAYASWGADPETLPGGLNRLARSQGLSTTWQPLPYPMDGNVAINLAGGSDRPPCVLADSAATPPFAEVSCGNTAQTDGLTLSRVQPAGIDPNGPAVEVTNLGPEPLDLAAVQLCSRGVCHPIVPLNQNPHAVPNTWLPARTVTLPEGARDPTRRRIVLAGGRALSAHDIITPLPGVASTDEVALFAPGRPATDAAHMLGYVRFSTTPKSHPAPVQLLLQMPPGQQTEAWQQATLQAPLLAGETLALKVAARGAPWSPDAWTLDASAFGTVLARGDSPYNACSAPARYTPRADLAIAQITAMGAEGVVFLLNTTPDPLLLENYSLAQGPNVAISLGTAALASGAPMVALAPGELLRVALSADMRCPEPYNICWSDHRVALDLGEITVVRLGTPVAHVQWGTTSLTSEYGQEATAAGVWPMPVCRIRPFTGEDDNPSSLVLLPNRVGSAPSDYVLGAQAVGRDIYVANP